jgi:hypothetical protein
MGKTSNCRRERERDKGESASVAERRSERHFGNPRVWGKHVFTKRGRVATGDLIKINEKDR